MSGFHGPCLWWPSLTRFMCSKLTEWLDCIATKANTHTHTINSPRPVSPECRPGQCILSRQNRWQCRRGTPDPTTGHLSCLYRTPDCPVGLFYQRHNKPTSERIWGRKIRLKPLLRKTWYLTQVGKLEMSYKMWRRWERFVEIWRPGFFNFFIVSSLQKL